MPGVFGIVSTEPVPAERLTREMDAMAQALRHRPSYRQHRHVGRRAAVGRIGPGVLNSEVQPIFAVGRSRCLLFDGELFRPDSVGGDLDRVEPEHLGNGEPPDSVRVLNALERDGARAVATMAGAYAGAWVDDARGACTLIVDRLGLRGCFYMTLPDGRFAFAPELKALAALAEMVGADRSPDEQAIAEMLGCGFCLFENTLLDGVAFQSHGSTVRFDGGQVTAQSYWDFPRQPRRGSFDDAVADGADLLKTAVRRQLRTPGRLGVLLSGGLDSRAIAAAAVDAGHPLPTFTLGSGRNSEVRLAARVARRLGVEHRHLEIQPTFLVDDGARGIWYSDGMFVCNHLHWLPHQGELARRTDSILSGYLGGVFVGGVFQDGRLPEGAPQSVVASTVADKLVPPVSPFLLEALTPRWRQTVEDGVARARVAMERRVGDRGYADELDRMYLMTHERRFTNWGNVAMLGTIGDVKYPFGDYDLLDYYGELPPDWRRGARLYKAMLVRAFPDLVDVPAISGNTKFVPTRIDRSPSRFRLWRRRQAGLLRFMAGRVSGGRISLPDRATYVHYAHWYRSIPRFRRWVDDLLLDDRTLARGIVDREGIRKVLDLQMTKGYVFDVLARLITLEVWHRQFVDGERPEPLDGRET